MLPTSYIVYCAVPSFNSCDDKLWEHHIFIPSKLPILSPLQNDILSGETIYNKYRTKITSNGLGFIIIVLCLHIDAKTMKSP